jgi:NO-binding membrane sensor protein with MHYT domain
LDLPLQLVKRAILKKSSDFLLLVLIEQAIILKKLKDKGFVHWLAAASLALGGCGIWAMHFTGMNAMTLPVPYAFNIGIVIVSFR